jgi:hypothetical protein
LHLNTFHSQLVKTRFSSKKADDLGSSDGAASATRTSFSVLSDGEGGGDGGDLK